jgi:hypothetical protein
MKNKDLQKFIDEHGCVHLEAKGYTHGKWCIGCETCSFLYENYEDYNMDLLKIDEICLTAS